MIAMSTSARKSSRRLRDFSLYIAIGMLIVVAAIGMAQNDISHKSFIRWGGLTVNTSVLFGYFIADSRPLFGRLSFWVLTIALLLVHLTVFAIVLIRVSEWKLVWFMVMLLEVPILFLLRDRLLKQSSR
jgi:hypothetical protein